MDIAALEQALIGGIISTPDSIVDISAIVSLDDFSSDMSKSIYAEIFQMWRSNIAIDTMTVVTRCDNSYLNYILDSANAGYHVHVKQYALDIAEHAKCTRLRNAISGFDYKQSAETLTDLLDIYNAEMTAGKKPSDIKSVMNRFDDHIQENKLRGSLGLDTGFDFMRDKMISYAEGHIWTLGGFTSTGKTAVMIEKISRVLVNNQDVNVVVISTEMTEEQLLARLIGNMTGIYSQKILSGKLNQYEDEKFSNVYQDIRKTKLHIYEDVFELSEIEAVARKHNLRDGIDILFIDYVQNCRVEGAKSEYQEQAIMAKSIQKLAKDVRATIVCLSQVSNSIGRGDTDNFELKGAGEWAAVSDIGIMLQRSKEDDTLLKLEVKKNRHGAKTKQVFRYSQDFTSLSEHDEYSN